MRTLAPESGLAAGYRISPPAADLPLWQLVVDLGFRPADDDPDDQPLHLVGASDLLRRRALERGVGEAVERRALRPEPPELSELSEPNEPSGRTLEWHRVGLASAPLSDGASLSGHALADGSRVRVPLGLIDYDQASTRLAAQAGGVYEPTPSGAASGASLGEATSSGLLELVERDAVMVAWGRQLHARRVRPESFGEHERSLVSPILEAYRAAGLDFAVADLRTDVAGVHAYAGLCFDHDGRIAALGSKAAASAAMSFTGCLQEALQALHLARSIRARFGARSVAPGPPRTELERARFWSTPAAYEHLRSWAHAFTPSSAPVTASSRPLTPSMLVSAVKRVGGEPIVVDLTSRLPEAVRDIGWHSVKVLCPGLQPLRMDDSSTFSWLSSRTSSASERTGYATSTRRDEVSDVPHPLV